MKRGDKVVLDTGYEDEHLCGVPTEVIKAENASGETASTRVMLRIRGRNVTVFAWQCASLDEEPERYKQAVLRNKILTFRERSKG